MKQNEADLCFKMKQTHREKGKEERTTTSYGLVTSTKCAQNENNSKYMKIREQSSLKYYLMFQRKCKDAGSTKTVRVNFTETLPCSLRPAVLISHFVPMGKTSLLEN